MQIYIADLSAYNAGYLKGEWVQLPTEEDEINDVLLRQSQNGKSDYAIHDWELPFKISEYTNPLKINEICTILKDLDINESLINHIEYAYGIDIKNTDYKTLSNYIDDTYTIEASNDIEFAQNYMYEYYYDQIESLPWEISYSIDYEIVYKKLEMTMSITHLYSSNFSPPKLLTKACSVIIQVAPIFFTSSPITNFPRATLFLKQESSKP